MIKEKKIITKYNYNKNFSAIVFDYVKTIILSILVAIIITAGLTIHARNEMIKNIYTSADQQKKNDKQLAEQFIQSNTNLLEDIKNKKYAICMNIGNLYETVGDYEKAQIAYESAMHKALPGNYKPYYKLILALAEQEKFTEIDKILAKIIDKSDKRLIKFKTRVYIIIGDKYYSIGKFLSAAKNYEKAEFYYDKFKKKDHIIEESIKNRIINSYIKVADTVVQMGYNSDAIRYLKKVEKLIPDDNNIKYKIGIILSDSDPEAAIKYLEPLVEKMPQNIDYGVYCNALMKAANIADLEGRPTVAKAYRYKIHSTDLFIKRKVIYKNDIDVVINSFKIKKFLFTYPIKASYNFLNMTGAEIRFMDADFVLTQDGKVLETVSANVANKEKPLYPGGYDPNTVNIRFKRKIFTKKELDTYTIKIYAYKDDKFKTFVAETKIPSQSYINTEN